MRMYCWIHKSLGREMYSLFIDIIITMDSRALSIQPELKWFAFGTYECQVSTQREFGWVCAPHPAWRALFQVQGPVLVRVAGWFQMIPIIAVTKAFIQSCFNLPSSEEGCGQTGWQFKIEMRLKLNFLIKIIFTVLKGYFTIWVWNIKVFIAGDNGKLFF